MTACLLALDTSTDRLAVALQTSAGRWCAEAAGGSLASATLIPRLMGLLAEARMSLGAVQAIAYGQGPGAFTGLRTACAVAQGLAFARQTPVLAIDSLLIVAEDARAQALVAGTAGATGDTADGEWWVAMDARMDEVYAAAYRHEAASGWQTTVAPRLWTLPALAEAWRMAAPARIAGNALAAFAGRLPIGDALVWPECVDRAAALLSLANAAWSRDEGRAAEQALPLYLRDKVALTTTERQALRAATPVAGAAG